MNTKHKKGFSLVELVVTMVIMSIASVVLAPMLIEGTRAYFTSRDVSMVTEEGRLGLTRIGDDLRSIRPGSFITTTPSTLSFIDDTGTTVTYSLSGSQLMRQQGAGPAQPLTDNVTGLSFSYLQQDGATATTTPANVFYVTVNLTQSLPILGENPQSQTFSTTFYPRNYP